ncbi:hypothetical protein BD626DRAFT_563639 [Schizophyllum amplum]|uniref:Uncharacterized protein n=1 Tax=Schizophyllum amplum TaxID=97359 RepID=A0A550CYS6_9AGAR|nr:hypothetical protein BD626DRAFT_563639 [Auriculariopsis ampla]
MFSLSLFLLASAPLLVNAANCAFDDSDDCTAGFSPGTYFGIAAAVFCCIFLLTAGCAISRRRRIRNQNLAFMRMQAGGAAAPAPAPFSSVGPHPQFVPSWQPQGVPVAPATDVNSPFFQPAPPYEAPKTPLGPGFNEPAYPPPSYKPPV